jgi:hypothetical protein
MHVQLEDKSAIVYGAAGSMGGAVARAFAREGARVFLAGRTLAKLDKVAGEIRSNGGAAETAQVDAMDQFAVESHANQVARTAGSIDISFNAISINAVQDVPLVDMSLEDFMNPDHRRMPHALCNRYHGGAAHDRARFGRDSAAVVDGLAGVPSSDGRLQPGVRVHRGPDA